MAKRVQSTELGASIAIDLVCGHFIDLAITFASVDPMAAENTLRIIEEESARVLAKLRNEFVECGEVQDTLVAVADLIGEMVRRAREGMTQA